MNRKMLAARCDISCCAAGYHAPHEAGKFFGYCSFCSNYLFVILQNNMIVAATQTFVCFVRIRDYLREIVISQEVLLEGLSVQSLRLQCLQLFNMSQSPVTRSFGKTVVVPQTEGKDLPLHFLEGEFMVIPHADMFFGLFILCCQNVDR